MGANGIAGGSGASANLAVGIGGGGCGSAGCRAGGGGGGGGGTSSGVGGGNPVPQSVSLTLPVHRQMSPSRVPFRSLQGATRGANFTPVATAPAPWGQPTLPPSVVRPPAV
eukprot:NODE_6224_length_521_cov_44.609442.p2 GENE.NODE_6224_length_521_cov_44.609442~~NODE_6224_length_521_cov_44.609442.p2  ORF type:complete len:111 (-),score=22.23 NODE_6224_length_521_cov_44.609442:171-503(-)